jgi:hypothetical protein
LSGSALAFNTLRMRVGQALTPALMPYLQVGQELTTIEGKVATLDGASSFAYVGPGISFSFGKFTLYGEGRFRQYYSHVDPNAPGLGPIDGRGLLVYGDFFSSPVFHSTAFDWFAELYSETVFSSADSANIINTDFARAGIRWKATPHLDLDLFVEPFVTVDRIHHYYYTRTDFKPSLRLQYVSAHFTLGLSGSYMWNHYFARGDYEPNPFLHVPAGVRGLLVVGASL